jgi:MarR family transcriptional regulator, organic hydroperoxide resistance regulator
MFERCLYFNVNALARAVNRIWGEAFQELGLSPAHAYLLRLVLAEPGASHKAIASNLRLEKSTVTRFIDSLQDKGLLKRSKVGAEDSREQRVFPTGKAKRMQAALEKKGDALYRKICANLGEAEIESLVTRLREATQILS